MLKGETREVTRRRRVVSRGKAVDVAGEVVVADPRASRAGERHRNLAEYRFECWECPMTRSVPEFVRRAVVDAGTSDLSCDEAFPVDRANSFDTSDRRRVVPRSRCLSTAIEGGLHFGCFLRPRTVPAARH